MKNLPKYWYYHKTSELIRELINLVRSNKPLSNKYLYFGSNGALNWKKVEDSYNLSDEKGNLLNYYFNDIKQIIGDSGFDLISLGCGTGKDDINILDKVSSYNINYKFSVIAVDLSWCLLTEGVQNIVDKVNDCSLINQADVFGLCCDFEELSRANDLLNPYLTTATIRKNRKGLFHLLGLTIGNSNETNLLRTIHSVMQEGDFLLLNVDFSCDNTNALQQSYNSYSEGRAGKNVDNFLLGPLNLSTRFEKNIDTYNLKTCIKSKKDTINYLDKKISLLKLIEKNSDFDEKLSMVPESIVFTRYYAYPEVIPTDASLNNEIRDKIKLIDYSTKYKSEIFKKYLIGLRAEDIHFKLMHNINEFSTLNIQTIGEDSPIQSLLILQKISPRQKLADVIKLYDSITTRLNELWGGLTTSQKETLRNKVDQYQLLLIKTKPDIISRLLDYEHDLESEISKIIVDFKQPEKTLEHIERWCPSLDR